MRMTQQPCRLFSVAKFATSDILEMSTERIPEPFGVPWWLHWLKIKLWMHSSDIEYSIPLFIVPRICQLFLSHNFTFEFWSNKQKPMCPITIFRRLSGTNNYECEFLSRSAIRPSCVVNANVGHHITIFIYERIVSQLFSNGSTCRWSSVALLLSTERPQIVY